ncbi:hypothetical protein ScPMuIL_000938 [Solemya velum]
MVDEWMNLMKIRSSTHGDLYYPQDEVETDPPGETYLRAERATDAGAVSELCSNQSAFFTAALFGRKPWAMQMVDSSGKQPSGVFKGKRKWLGAYDECKDIIAPINYEAESQPYFTGKYCTATIRIKELGPTLPTMELGVCVPSGCSSNDTRILYNRGIPFITIGKAEKVECEEKKDDFDIKAIAAMSVMGVIAVFLVAGTTHDIIYPKSKSDYLCESQISVGDDPRLEDSIARLATARNVPPSTAGKCLLAFSMLTNSRKILSMKQAPGSLTVLNGIRCLSISWVVLGHTYNFGLGAVENMADLGLAKKDWEFQVVVNALVSVDTFFLLSGLLVSYLALKELEKKGSINFAMFYFHRFWRLTPPYMLLMLLYVPLFKYWGDGPMWAKDGYEYNSCEDTWWTNLLYVNNFVRAYGLDKMCMAWSWYLANDMQFYWVSPLLFLPLYYSKVLGRLSCLAFLLGTTITPAVLAKINHLPPTVMGGGGDDSSDANTYFIEYYIKPYCRMGPYIVGIILGYVLFKNKCNAKMNKLTVLIGWCSAIFTCLAVLYGLYDAMNDNPVSDNVSALYNALHRTAWAAGIGWVIFACVTGYGGTLNTFLSWKGWLPLTRLTYCVYLVHPIVIIWASNTRKTLIHYDVVNISYLFIGHMAISCALAFILSLAFEAPMMGMERAIFRRGREPPKLENVDREEIEMEKVLTQNRTISDAVDSTLADGEQNMSGGKGNPYVYYNHIDEETNDTNSNDPNKVKF